MHVHTLAVYVTRRYTMQIQPHTSLIIASADYTNTTSDLMFGPHNRNQCVLIPVINDMVPESKEYFRVKLAMTTPLPAGIVLTPDISITFINDDDGKC